jgi:hypothetical protein
MLNQKERQLVAVGHPEDAAVTVLRAAHQLIISALVPRSSVALAALAVEQQPLHLAQVAQAVAAVAAQQAAVAAVAAAAVLQLHALLQVLHVQQHQHQVVLAELADLAVTLPAASTAGTNSPFFLAILYHKIILSS